MEVLTLDDPPRPSKLRPLLLVANRQKPSTILPRPPLSEPAFSIDAFTRRMEALILSDRPPTNPGASIPEPDYAMDALIRSMDVPFLSDALPSASKLKSLILVTKRASGQLEVRTPLSTQLPLLQPTTLIRDATGFLPVPDFPPKRKLEPALHTVSPMSEVPYDQSGRRTKRPPSPFPTTWRRSAPIVTHTSITASRFSFPSLHGGIYLFFLLYWYDTDNIGLISGMYVYFSHFLLYLEVLFDLFSPLLVQDRHWTDSVSLRTHLWHVS
ncbi:hypothetical protein DFH29DRAFT_887837 [Suillus ampliporus]|nr:hypothetical protein DFH29DRAFT_887837 [Suillus ampliporus]